MGRQACGPNSHPLKSWRIKTLMAQISVAKQDFPKCVPQNPNYNVLRSKFEKHPLDTERVTAYITILIALRSPAAKKPTEHCWSLTVASFFYGILTNTPHELLF